MIYMIHIYRATRGKYSNPIPISEANINWVDSEGKLSKPPKELRCQHDKHWEYGSGTRNGQKLWYPYSEMFYQVWKLTKKELREAVDQYDMASLDMPNKIICKNCRDHI